VRELSDYISTSVNPRGKTPSFQAKLGSDLSQRYQIKRSNFIKIFRKMIGLDSDQSDILGEYIASKVIAELLNEKSQVPKSLSEKSQVPNNRTKQWASQITPNTNRIAPNNISHSISFSDKSKQSNNKKGRL
jgi:hypothetical protein